MIPIDELKKIKLVCFDFDGVFTNNFVYVDQNGIESVRCFRSDGIGIERLKKTGIRTKRSYKEYKKKLDFYRLFFNRL